MTPKQIKAYRTRARLTQEQLARVLGVTALTVSRWERGSSPPGRGAVDRLRRLFEPDHYEQWARHQADLLNMRINPPEDLSLGIDHGVLTRGLLDLQAAGAQCGASVVAIGAAAMGAHGFPRATKDFDVVGPRPEDAECFLSLAEQRGFTGFATPVSVPQGPAMRYLPLAWPAVLVNGLPMTVEAFLLESEFLESIVDRAKTTRAGVRVASLEDVLLLKLGAWRMKDQMDVLWILSNKPKLDRRYLKKWIATLRLEEALDEAEVRAAAGDNGW